MPFRAARELINLENSIIDAICFALDSAAEVTQKNSVKLKTPAESEAERLLSLHSDAKIILWYSEECKETKKAQDHIKSIGASYEPRLVKDHAVHDALYDAWGFDLTKRKLPQCTYSHSGEVIKRVQSIKDV